jgi:hypothetical protein
MCPRLLRPPALVLCAWVAAAAAQPAPSDAEMALARAALALAAFDRLSALCAQGPGFSAAEQRQIDQWQAANGVPQLRTQLQRADAMAPPMRRQVDDAALSVVHRVTRGGIGACAAAVTVTRTPDAQFATHAPQWTASVRAGKDAPAAEPKDQIAAPATGSDLAASIEGFGFDSCAGIGVGGMVVIKTCPVVLFKNGDALTEVTGLAHAQGLAAHKASKPKDWTQWRRSGGTVQTVNSKGQWENLGFPTVYPALPKDFRLEGLFRALGGSGTAAIGGTQSVAAWTDYRFFADGRVERGGGAGAAGSAGDVSVVTRSTRTGKAGRYRIDGLTLAIQYDDGSSERRILIADPKDARRAIWLDGEGYVQRGP